MKHLANPWIHGLASYEAGRPIEEVARELGFNDVDEIVKIASNENSLGPSPKAMAAMNKASKKMHIYPDGACFYLRQALAKRLKVHMDEVLVGNGSNELIEFLGHTFLEPGTNIVMSSDAFVIYKLMASVFQAQTISVPSKNFTHDLEGMLKAITPKTRLVFVSNPNNPTGTMVDEAALDGFMARVPEHVVVVLDEAYIELLPEDRQPDTLKYVKQGRHVFVLRTFSKTYGLAGLRVGYAVAPKEGIDLLHRVRQPFNINLVAQAGALAALDDVEHYEHTLRATREGMAWLHRELEALGCRPDPSHTKFFLIDVRGDATRLFEAMLYKGVIVRSMKAYGYPDFIRITVGTDEENRRFVAALAECVKDLGYV